MGRGSGASHSLNLQFTAFHVVRKMADDDSEVVILDHDVLSTQNS